MCDKVYEFDPGIYPRRLWVAVSKSSFDDKFEGVTSWDNSAYAITNHVYNKDTRKGGIMIRFGCRKDMTAGKITHEASHAAMEIFDYIGAYPDPKNQEPFAYLCGWIADCIELVKLNKAS